MSKSMESRLRQLVGGLESALVAFSGGVDSSVVAYVAAQELGDRAAAATGISASLPDTELVGIRALCLGQLTLADSLFTHLVSVARRASLTHRVAIARFWLTHVHALQGNLGAARTSLSEIGALSAPRRFLANLWPSWASPC